MFRRQTSSNRESGFSMIELSMALVLSTIMLYTLHSTLHASMSGRRSGDRAQTIHELSRDYLERLRNLPFGRSTDPKASGSQLTELFDDDDVYGSLTLNQVAVPVTSPGHTFGVSTRGVSGTFRVKVTNDLDGDGLTDGFREGRTDILGIHIFFNERLVYRTAVSADPAMTTIDTGIDYLGGV